jgi:hypothetical protein
MMKRMSVDDLITKILNDEMERNGKPGDWTVSDVRCPYCRKIFNTVSGGLHHQSFEHPDKLKEERKWYHCRGYIYED